MISHYFWVDYLESRRQFEFEIRQCIYHRSICDSDSRSILSVTYDKLATFSGHLCCFVQNIDSDGQMDGHD